MNSISVAAKLRIRSPIPHQNLELPGKSQFKRNLVQILLKEL